MTSVQQLLRLSLILLPTFAWSCLDSELSLTQFASKRWDISNGLDDSWVRDTCQIEDRFGIWIATAKGITHFNGNSFRVFNDESSILLSGGTHCLEPSGSGKMYVGTERHGVLLFADGSLKQVGDSNQYGSRISTLKKDQQQRLWIGGENGLFLKQGDSITPYPTENPIRSPINVIEEGSDGSIWVGSRTSLYQFHPEKPQLQKTFQHLNNTICILPVDDQNTWIGTPHGLKVIHHGINKNDITIENISLDQLNLTRDRVAALTMDKMGCIYIGTINGVYRYSNGKILDPHSTGPLSTSNISSLFFDNEGSFWIGTRFSGIWQLWSDEFIVYSNQEGLINPVVNVVYQDVDGVTWIGADHGLHQLKENEISQVYNQYFKSLRVRDILKDSGGILWVATYSGVFRIEKNGSVDKFDNTNGLPSNFARQIVEDSKGRIWIGTRAGLVMFEAINGTDNEEFQSTIWKGDDLKNQLILYIHEDRNNAIWICTDGGGIARYHQDEGFQWFGESEGLRSEIVFKIHEESNGRFWLSTSNGISMFDGQRFLSFSRPEGLPFETIFQILESPEGQFWLTSREGPIKIQKQDLLDYWNGKTETVPCEVYGTLDGLRTNKMTSVGESCVLSDGSITFASRDGIAILCPHEYENIHNILISGAHINSFKVNGDEVAAVYPEATHLTIPPGVKTLRIGYSGNSLIACEDVHFRTRLIGFDNDFQKTNKPEVAYTNLAPGDYTFEIFCNNSKGEWNVVPNTISFRIKPYFYQTFWFPLLMTITIFIVIVILANARSYQIRKQRNQLESIVKKRTLEVTTQKEIIEAKVAEHEKTLRRLEITNSELKKVNEEKSHLLGVAAHDMKNPLSAIKYLSDEIAAEANNFEKCTEYASIISKASSELFDLVFRLTESISLEEGSSRIKKETEDLQSILNSVVQMNRKPAEKKNIRITTELPDKIEAYVDGLRIQMAMDNYLSNAIKFTPEGGTVKICLSKHQQEKQNYVRFSVTDSGPGLAEEDFEKCFQRFSILSAKPTGGETSNGLGLSIVKQVADLHKGTVSVSNNADGKGATFSFEIPFM